MYRKIPLENAQRIINLTASEKEITLQKARMIKTVIKVAVKCPNTPKIISNNNYSIFSRPFHQQIYWYHLLLPLA